MRGYILAVVAAFSLAGCNMVMTAKPMFTVSDRAGAPPIRPGVWRTDKPDCVFDDSQPQNLWPSCAGAKPSLGDNPLLTEVGGSPDLFQVRLSMPGAANADTRYVYIAFRPLKLEGSGRVIAMKSWPVRCGPPPPPAAIAAELPSPDAKAPPAPAAPETPSDGMSEADRAKMKADMAKLSDETARLSAALARVTPTKNPLPGLAMDSQMGSCTPASAAALRNAAKASEAWVDDDAVSHWLRERGPGDLPQASLAALRGALGTSPVKPEPAPAAASQPTPPASSSCGGLKVITDPSALTCR